MRGAADLCGVRPPPPLTLTLTPTLTLTLTPTPTLTLTPTLTPTLPPTLTQPLTRYGRLRPPKLGLLNQRASRVPLESRSNPNPNPNPSPSPSPNPNPNPSPNPNPNPNQVPLEPLARTRLLLGTRTALCEGGEPRSP